MCLKVETRKESRRVLRIIDIAAHHDVATDRYSALLFVMPQDSETLHNCISSIRLRFDVACPALPLNKDQLEELGCCNVIASPDGKENDRKLGVQYCIIRSH